MTPAVKLLEQRKVSFDLLSYQHDVGNQHYADEAASKLDLPVSSVFKTLIVECSSVSNIEFVVAVLPANQQLSMKKLSKYLGAKKAQMADAKKVQSMSGYVLGGVSPFAQKKKLTTLLDSSARQLDQIYVSAGKRGLEIKLTPADFLSMLDAQYVDISAQ